MGRDAGVSDEQLQDLAAFEDSPHFDQRDKAVLRFAEGMTRTPPEVSDVVFGEFASFFSPEQIVELTAAVALENFRARFNCTLKVESDNLCMLPPDHPVRLARGSSFQPRRNAANQVIVLGRGQFRNRF